MTDNEMFNKSIGEKLGEKGETELTEMFRLTVLASALLSTTTSVSGMSYCRDEITQQVKVCTEIMRVIKDKIKDKE